MPSAGEKIIPRNYGQGPTYFSANLRIGRTFSFGGSSKGAAPQANRGTAQPPAARSALPTGSARSAAAAPAARPSTPGAGPAAAREARPYKLTISIYGSNIFNRTNAAQPIGNLSSLLFGQSTAIQTFGLGSGSGAAAANRSISLLAQFSF
jgi:hypothetical protein